MPQLIFPNLRQTYDWDCGVIAVQSILAYYGMDVRADEIIKITQANKKYGTTVSGIKNALKNFGLSFQEEKMTVNDIKKYLDKKIPVILPIQAWRDKNKSTDWQNGWDDGHYVVATGYDSRKMYFHDPATIWRASLSYINLQKRWHDKDARGKKYINWGIAIYGKKPQFTSSKIINIE